MITVKISEASNGYIVVVHDNDACDEQKFVFTSLAWTLDYVGKRMNKEIEDNGK